MTNQKVIDNLKQKIKQNRKVMHNKYADMYYRMAIEQTISEVYGESPSYPTLASMFYILGE